MKAFVKETIDYQLNVKDENGDYYREVIRLPRGMELRVVASTRLFFGSTARRSYLVTTDCGFHSPLELILRDEHIYVLDADINRNAQNMHYKWKGRK